MHNLKFDKVDILLADPDRNSRDGLKMVLHNNGFRELRFGDTLGDIIFQINKMTPDMIICSSELPDGDFCGLVAEIRHQKIGANPFLPIIATTWNPTPELVRQVIESGADYLLTKPISTVQLLDRIRSLIKSRKKFVVTNDYVGPVRSRKDSDDDETPKMEVPNTLKAKATGEKVDIAAIQHAIDAAIGEVNLRQLEGHAEEIGGLVSQIVPNLEMGGKTGETIKELLGQLIYVAKDTARRLGGTKYDHVSGLCRTLIEVSNAIFAAEGEPSPKDIKLLPPLSKAIQAGFADTASATAAREISASIKR